MDYLVYVSHDAENLQFWLWLQDYTKRFYAAPKSDQLLSPPWHQVEPQQPISNDLHNPDRKAPTPAVTEFEVNFDNEIPVSPILSPQFDKQSFISGIASTARTTADSVDDANAGVGLKWQSFTVQPFRAEINRVISHYLAPNSPRELNLSHRNRAAVLHALQHTTHPSALSLVKDMVEGTLRGQSHPNFIRWSICNGNKPRVMFVKWNGYLHVFAGLVLTILLILSHKSRWWRLFAFPLLFIGFDIMIAAYKGLCVIIHTSHCRALRPWEQFSDSASLSSFDAANDDEATLGTSSTDEVYSMSSPYSSRGPSKSGGRGRGISMDTFGTSNSYGHEGWVERYRNKPLVRKVFAKQIWIQDETVRLLQDKIVMQSHVWAISVVLPLQALLVALPVYGKI